MADAHLTSRLWESCVPGGASGFPHPGVVGASPGDSLTDDRVGRTAASGQSGVAWKPPPEETPGRGVLTDSCRDALELGLKIAHLGILRLLGREFEGGTESTKL